VSDSPYIYNVTQADFQKIVLEGSLRVPVLVDFWADWCGPCHMLMPILAKLVEEYQGQILLAKVNSDEQQALALQYGVRSLPTVKIFKNGNIVDEFMGTQPESVIRQLLEKHVVRESDKIRAKAIDILDKGDTAQALELLHHAAGMDPGNASVKIDLAKVLMRAGKSDEAETVLNDFKGDDRDQPEVRTLLAQLTFARIAAEEPDSNVLESKVASNPDDLKARYHLSAHKILSGDYDAALDHLFEIMRRDRKFEEDAGRKGLLSVFEILGSSDSRVTRYRSKMFNILH
jgi:putative thioredoxin